MEKFMETTKQAGYAKELKLLKDNHEVFKDGYGRASFGSSGPLKAGTADP
jgi:hypothetical protein